ncbi:Protein kinase, putative [Hondaea fermentalgiana]|uniref:Protein kinase, putative n=1 Tax=Hondaea fermentalgiana TaxID=2315210 RepID=A0A2R5G8V5_9STRA|nr:Protein kinase, putative [Hondaea fermentalgiana]|eukprot:GBG26208.1 Protein kinase, putative [Hondaea fermentalgiana]
MDRVRDSLTRCGGCERYVCCCQTGVDNVQLAHRVPGNHLSSYLARKHFRLDHFDLSGRTNHVNAEREVLEKLCERDPRIINLLAYFREPGIKAWHLVLEFAPGGTLENRIRAAGVLNIEDAKYYAAQTYLAVRFLRAENVAHRDVKPSNLLITARGHIKLSGFTYAKILRPGERTYTLIGTVNYMAPEILQGARMTGVNSGADGYDGYDGIVDWWSVGACIYEMVQGAAPFSNCETPEDQLRGLETFAAEGDLPRIRRCADARAWDLVNKFMCLDPKARREFAESPAVKSHELFKFYKREKLQWSLFDNVSTYPPPPFVPKHVNASAPHENYALLPDIRRAPRKKRHPQNES